MSPVTLKSSPRTKPMRNICRVLFLLGLLSARLVHAQSDGSSGTVDVNVRVIRYSGSTDPFLDRVQLTFSLYETETSSSPLWQELQSVPVTNGRFTALIGSTEPNGLPENIFRAEQASWLGIVVNGVEVARQRLIAVPYAMKAMDADRIGGFSVSDLLTKREFQGWLSPLAATRDLAAALSPEGAVARPPRPLRTDPPFTTPFRFEQDGYVYTERNAANLPSLEAVALSTTAGNSASGVLGRSVAPNGTGVNGISTGINGAGVRGEASASSGTNFGLFGTTLSAAGYGAVFNNQAAGKIAGFQSAGTEVAFVDAAGFHGSGANLSNIPTAALVGTISGASVTGNIAGSAASATIATNALQLGGVPAANYALGPTVSNEAASRIAADTALQSSVDAAAASITALSPIAAKTNQANTFAANARQTVTAGATNAGFNLTGVNTDPSTLLNGDIWLRADQSRLFARVNGVSRGIAFTDDPTSGNVATATALAANGTNCAAGQYTRGIDAAGNAENCSTDGSAFTSLNPANLTNGTANINISGNAATATSAQDANSLGGVAAGNYVIQEAFSTLQSEVLSLVAGKATLGGTDNHFTNNNFFVEGIQDFTQSSKTLPLRTVTVRPPSCSAGTEMLIESTAPASQQVLLCNQSGTGWDVVGADGTTSVPVVKSPTSTAFAVTINPLGLIINTNTCAVDLTVSVPGAAVGDSVVIALSPTSGAGANFPGGLMPFAWVHSADSVTLRLCNGGSSAISVPANPVIVVSGRVLKF
jgi:hypothetical protein